MKLVDYLGEDEVRRLSLPSNFKYGTAIYDRGGVEFISIESDKAEAWVGGLDGTVINGAGSRRRTYLSLAKGGLSWHCTGNPKNHDVFCKHCVALAFALMTMAK